MRLEPSSALDGGPGEDAASARVSPPIGRLRDRRDQGCVLCTAAVEVVGSGVPTGPFERLCAALSLALPTRAGAVEQDGERMALWLTPRSWLVLCPAEQESALCQAVTEAYPERLVLASRYSDQLCWIELNDEGAEDALRQGGFLTLRVGGLPLGHAKRTLIAGIPVVLLRLAATCWLLGVERSRARYFVDWLAHLTL